LVESRFRKEVTEQIKGSLLMDSMAQVNEDEKLAAISEPDINLDAIEVPKEGAMTFEFDLEVRPDFDLPKWRGLKLERPTCDFTREDVDRQLRSVLASYGRWVPSDKPATEGDSIVTTLVVRHEGDVLTESAEQTICLRPTLSFRDGKVEDFAKQMVGVKAGETREVTLTLSDDAPNEDLAGKEVTIAFEVLDTKQFELPEMNEEFLKEIGNFETEGDLRDAVMDSLERQLSYEQQQVTRRQVTELLIEAASWELPPELLKRQGERELQRSVMELRRSGFSDQDIQAHANELRQNSGQSTAKALREHFILERIAEDEKLDVTDDDYDEEIALIARQSSESPRRVRAQIEKQDQMDSLRNQIIERKVIDLVIENAEFKDKPFTPSGGDTEAVDLAVGGGETSDIPVATKADAEALSTPKQHS